VKDQLNEKRHRCSRCGKKLRTEAALTDHTNALHPEHEKTRWERVDEIYHWGNMGMTIGDEQDHGA